jgi:NAD(P)-dependent dehydrogenase (short-subunit alcohol dehydrogenase family)
MSEFEGKTALVTGGASGIGEATAKAFAECGANVVILDRDAERGAAVAAELEAARPGRSLFLPVDVTAAASVEAAVARVVERFGGLDIAVNNAGITGPAKLTAELTEDEWDTVLAVNLKSVWLCMRAEIGVMLGAGRGAIVNIASTAGLRGGRRTAAYSASKHGVLGLTKSAALDYGKAGLRINAVCPGAIETPMLERLMAPNPRLKERLAERSVMGRHGQPEEIARTVLWLASGAASFVNGQAIAVDGGSSA